MTLRKKEECGNCNGTGYVNFAYANGICFTCQGRKYVYVNEREQAARRMPRGQVIREIKKLLDVTSAFALNEDSYHPLEFAKLYAHADADVRERMLEALKRKGARNHTLTWIVRSSEHEQNVIRTGIRKVRRDPSRKLSRKGRRR